MGTLRGQEGGGGRGRNLHGVKGALGKPAFLLTLERFPQALAQLPAMLLQQAVSNIILTDRTEKQTKNIPIIYSSLPTHIVKNHDEQENFYIEACKKKN